MSKYKEAKENLAVTRAKMAELVTAAKATDSQLLTAEQRDVFDKYNTEIERYKSEIASHERMERFESALLEDAKSVKGNDVRVISNGHPQEDFARWLQAKAGWIDEDSPELRSDTFATGAGHRYLGLQTRANEPQTVTLNSGNFGSQLVPTTLADFVSRFAVSVFDVRSICRNISTAGTGAFDVPILNDTTNKALLIAETTADAILPVGTNKTTLNAYCYTSGILLVSKELLKSSAYDAVQFFAEDLGGRIARGRAYALTVGSGSSDVTGYMTAATTTGVTLASNSAVTLSELTTAYHALPIHYRANATWVMSDSFAQAVRSLVDGNGRPLVSVNPYPSAASPFAETIFGRPMVIDPNLEAMSANDHTVCVLGDFSNYLVRSITPQVEVAVSDQRYWEKRAIALVSYFWHDAKMLQAGAFRRIRTIAT